MDQIDRPRRSQDPDELTEVRFAVRDVPPGTPIGHRQVQVYLDDLEITERAAGLGMDPFDLLVPRNLLVALDVPRQTPIARCTCGDYGCGMTDVVVTRAASHVRWAWMYQAPLPHDVVFDADQYDQEVGRLGSDRSWEHPYDTVRRLVEVGADHPRLLALGRRLHWGVSHDGELATVGFSAQGPAGPSDPHAYQVLVSVSADTGDPHHDAALVLEELRRPPNTWRATWMATRRDLVGPPIMTGPRWIRRQR